MIGKNDKRKRPRFEKDVLLSTGKYSAGDLFIEIKSEPPIRGEVINLSQNGISILLSGLEGPGEAYLRDESEFFMNLHFGDEFIVLGVNKIWGDFSHRGKQKDFAGGYSIEIISPQDNLFLYRIIEKIRNIPSY